MGSDSFLNLPPLSNPGLDLTVVPYNTSAGDGSHLQVVWDVNGGNDAHLISRRREGNKRAPGGI